MLYDEETLRGAVLRVYEYLSNQYVAEKRPHQYKPDKPVHRKALDGFVKSLPDSAGFDFIWKFLTYQFYIYDGQNQERRPLVQWFLGKEAWRRWNEYDEGMKYHVEQWCTERSLSNPILSQGKFIPLSSDIFDRERVVMSRSGGPVYCSMKVEDPYTPGRGICKDCPYDNVCSELWNQREGSVVVVEETY